MHAKLTIMLSWTLFPKTSRHISLWATHSWHPLISAPTRGLHLASHSPKQLQNNKYQIPGESVDCSSVEERFWAWNYDTTNKSMWLFLAPLNPRKPLAVQCHCGRWIEKCGRNRNEDSLRKCTKIPYDLFCNMGPVIWCQVKPIKP